MTYIIIFLFDFPFESIQQHGTISLLLLLIEYFFPTCYQLWLTEQAVTTSTAPVNHISELKVYNKIIYNSII